MLSLTSTPPVAPARGPPPLQTTSPRPGSVPNRKCLGSFLWTLRALPPRSFDTRAPVKLSTPRSAQMLSRRAYKDSMASPMSWHPPSSSQSHPSSNAQHPHPILHPASQQASLVPAFWFASDKHPFHPPGPWPNQVTGPPARQPLFHGPRPTGRAHMPTMLPPSPHRRRRVQILVMTSPFSPPRRPSRLTHYHASTPSPGLAK